MNPLELLLSDAMVQRLGWALLHSLWQGALVACTALVASGGAAFSAPTADDAPETTTASEEDSPEPSSDEDGDEYVWACTTEDSTSGELIPGVRISWEFHGKKLQKSLWKGEFISDPTGHYEVRVPKSIVDSAGKWIEIAYHHPRYLPKRRAGWPLRMPSDLRKGLDHRHAKLTPGVKVTGRVVLPDGSPAQNVPIMFARNREGFGDHNGGYHNGFWTHTDEEGRYLFYTRNTWPQRIHWFPAQFESNSKALTKNFGEQETIRLKSGLTLTGRITDHEGQPLSGIVVRASTGTRVPLMFATSQDDGVFRFTPLPAGKYGLIAVRSYHDNSTGEILSAELPFPIPSIVHALNASNTSTDPKAVIKASPLVTIPVEVVDGEGNSKSRKGLSIGAISDFVNAVRAKPVEGSPGKYEFLFPQGQYIRDLKLQCSMGETAFYQLSRDHAPVPADGIVLGKAQKDHPTVHIVVRESATLHVKVRTEDGQEPTERLSVSVSFGPETATRRKAAEQANRQPRASFMAPRFFNSQPAGQPWNPTFQQLPPGEPIVVTVRSGSYRVAPQTVTLKDGETKDLEIVVKKIDTSDKK